MAARSRLTADEAAFVAAQRVARLATASAEGVPSLVPICFAFDGERFYSALDEKPKRVQATALRRVRDIAARGEAALLFDRYDDDWSRLGYVLVRGHAELLGPVAAEHSHALELLRARYPQYRTMDLESRPVIAVTPARVRSWGPALGDLAPRPPLPAGRGGDSVGASGGRPPMGQDAITPWLEPGRGGDFLALARGRQTVRTFAGRPVPREALLELVEAARWAPSPHGRQPWRFVVLTRDEPKQRLAAAMGDEWRGVLAMDGEPEAIIARRLARSRERIEHAPALLLACLYLEDLDRYPDPDRQRAEQTMAVQSLGAAIENALLAAYALGLDAGWMCAPLFSPDTVRIALDLDAALIPHALIAVGYKAAEPKRRPHRPAEELIVRFD
ncbi:MAG TPA: TIGR03668 family PPOX class F420-dependent oxidoreductase [Ktedonobacterales bacterium]